MTSTHFISSALNDARDTLVNFLNDSANIKLIEKAVSMLATSLGNGGKAYSCGNGGSMCDAMHFAEELTGRFRKDRRPLPAQAINDPAHISCVANDFGYDQIFSRYVSAFGTSKDVLLAISTSGNSQNIILAVEAARQNGMQIIGLLGKGGGKLKNLVDCPIVVPSQIPDRIQEMHIKLIHIFIEGIERNIFPNHYPT